MDSILGEWAVAATCKPVYLPNELAWGLMVQIHEPMMRIAFSRVNGSGGGHPYSIRATAFRKLMLAKLKRAIGTIVE